MKLKVLAQRILLIALSLILTILLLEALIQVFLPQQLILIRPDILPRSRE